MSEGGGQASYVPFNFLGGLFGREGGAKQPDPRDEARYIADFIERTGQFPGVPNIPRALSGAAGEASRAVGVAALRSYARGEIGTEDFDWRRSFFSALPPAVPVLHAQQPLPAGHPASTATLPSVPIPRVPGAQYVTILLYLWELYQRLRQRPRAPTYGYPYPVPSPGSVGGGGSMPNVPALIPGDYLGTGPGIDFGDIYGPNSWACRTLGIGCGSGGVPRTQEPFYPSQPAPPFYNVVGGGTTGPMINGAMGMGGCPVSPFRAGGQVSARAVPFVAINPVSGRPVWFGPLGMPLLWSGDLRAARRVSKIAARAARFSRRRRRGGR